MSLMRPRGSPSMVVRVPINQMFFGGLPQAM